MPGVVRVSHLTKIYRVPERDGGMAAAFRGLVKRQWREVHAVEDISFDIEAGEVVGFLGPNGAGKTTTLKMLSGLLHPTSGDGHVLGHVPSKREREYLRRMTLVMGNRNQLQWDLPALDSFELNRAIYRLLYLVPIGFAVTVPAQALTNRLEWPTVAIALGFGIALTAFTRWFWRFGLRRYSGASA